MGSEPKEDFPWLLRVISIKFHVCIQLTFLNLSEVSATMQDTGDTNLNLFQAYEHRGEQERGAVCDE